VIHPSKTLIKLEGKHGAMLFMEKKRKWFL
jgi:hypothetical protein